MHRNNEYMDKTSFRKQDYLAADAATQPQQFFRASSRLFCLNGEWFFQTRENDHGPFTKREAAELALDRYTKEMQDIEAVTGASSSAAEIPALERSTG